jgi:hypothetical protein
MNRAVCCLVCLLVVGNFALISAADSSLGVASANGKFAVNNAPVSGNATIFSGTVVQTGEIPSRVQLAQGQKIALAANSRAKFHQDRLVLESGMSDLVAAGKYEIEAGTLRISPATPDSAARVAHPKKEIIEVAALKGSLRVFDSRGLQIANVFPGTAIAFEPQQSGGAAPSSFMGCLLKKNDIFVLYDQTTRIIVELRGTQDFESQWGNRVQAVGTTDTAAESTVGAQILDVSSLTQYAPGGCDPVAAAIGAEGPAGPPQAAGAVQPGAASPPAVPAATGGGGGGMSAGTKVLVAVAVGGGGAAAVVLATQGGDDRSN